MRILLMLNEPVFTILFAQCLCRLSRGSHQVVLGVRLGFIAIALAAVYCLSAPYVWGVAPTWPEIILGTAMVLRQWSTAEQWAVSIPDHVLKRGPDGQLQS